MSSAVIATAVAGAAVVGTCGLAVPRAGRAKLGVIGAALAYTVWTAASVALLLGMPQIYFWAVARPLILVMLSVAIVTSPGVQRSAAKWLDVLLDGAITASGMFGTLWFVIHAQTAIPLTPVLEVQTLWLAFQLLLLVPLAGLLNRTVPGNRVAPVLTFGIGALVLAGDMLAILTGRPSLGITFWMAGGLMISVALLVMGGNYYENTFDDPTRPRQMRWWQLPLLPVALYAIDPGQIDLVVVSLGYLIFVTMCIHLVVHSGQNERLWDSLSSRTRLYQNALRDSQDVIILMDDQYRIEYANAAAEFVLGTRPEALIGHQLAEWTDQEVARRARAQSASFDFALNGPLRIEAPFNGDDGVVRTIEWAVSDRAEQPGLALSGRDFSERSRLQHELVASARTDALTGLLNRAAFLAEADQRLGGGRGAALIIINLDHFTLVNDTMGHAAGDSMLSRAAQRLAQAAGPGDLVARLGGDEFAILARTNDPDDAMARARAVVRAFAEFDPDPRGRTPVSISAGVVIAESGRSGPPRLGTDLVRDASLAVYQAKQRGGAGAVRFERWMTERVLERSRKVTEFESAIQHGSLLLHMQPLVTLPAASWTGFEALVRWPLANRLRPPDEFLPLAKESGLIVPMGGWVLNEALRQLATWPDRTMGLAVNISAQQLAAPGFGAMVMTALISQGIEPGRLTLEISEQTTLQDLGRTTSRLRDLRAEGVRTAIDDFGSGYSSMQYLARLPVDTIKIDPRFIWGLGEHSGHDELVRSLIRLAGEMGFTVIAEGVETPAQADQLIEFGCRFAQGFHFSRPRPLTELLATRSTQSAQPAQSAQLAQPAQPIPAS